MFIIILSFWADLIQFVAMGLYRFWLIAQLVFFTVSSPAMELRLMQTSGSQILGKYALEGMESELVRSLLYEYESWPCLFGEPLNIHL